MTTPIEEMLKSVNWIENEFGHDPIAGLPVATHSGVLDIMGHRLRVHRLSDGRAIVDADDMAEFLKVTGFCE